MTDKPMAILQRSSDMIQLLAGRGRLGPADVAEQVGMPRPSVYRLAEALSQADLAETLPDSRIRVSLRWLRLADSARAAMTEWRQARGVLDDLARSTSQTIFLSVPRGDQSICIDWAMGRAINVLILKPGRALPLHAGAAGRVTLAFRAESPDPYLAQAPFPTFTARTLTTAGQLRKDIAITRERGFSISDEDVTEGIGALGVPLISPTTGFAGALSLAGLAPEINSRRTELSEQLLAAAQVLSSSLP
jgi:IclR family transcriptional regulator, acetate operon repressor